MKLAKKTLSVALAAVMAASSLAGATSAFADDVQKKAVESSAVKYTTFSGSATVTPNVTIDNSYAKKTAELTTDELKKANKIAQVDQTTLSTYYSFTPSRTGYYTMHVESTPVYEGYSYAKYESVKNNNAYPTAQDKADYAHTYATKPDGLYSDTTFTADKALKTTDAIDSVTIDNVTSEDQDNTTRDAFVKAATTVSSKTNVKKDDAHVLSYKYVNYNSTMKGIVPDKTVAEVSTGKNVALDTALLTAGKTYYFKATLNQDLVISTKEETDSKNDKYTKTVKANVGASAKISVSVRQGMVYGVEYNTVEEKDYQKLEVPDADTSYVINGVTYKAAYDTKTGKFMIALPVEEGVATASYYGMDTAATVADTKDGAKVEAFENYFGGLQSLTLGKNVKYVDGVSKTEAPNLKTVVINNPEFMDFSEFDQEKVTFSVPANSAAWYAALSAGYKVNVVCTAHKWTTVKAATIFAAGQKKCSECGTVATIAKVKFAPTAKASKKNIVVKGNAGKVNKLAVWVYNSNGKLVKKQVKKNVTKNTVKVSKAGKYTVKVKAYGPNGAKTSSVKKTVKVK